MIKFARSAFAGAWIFALAGCAVPLAQQAKRPSVAPTSQPTGQMLALDGPRPEPMYHELLAIDLPTVTRVAKAENVDVKDARLRVEAAAGRYESSFGAIFPVISPGATFDQYKGRVRAVNGPLLAADFSAFAPSAIIQWALNPGRVYYDIVASKKRLDATEHQERQTLQETLRVSANQYYDLVLAQARLAVAQRAVTEGEELQRITQLRLRAGAGLEADSLRAEADLARRQQDLALAMNAFYEASVALSLTLHLDATVTLVPRADRVPPIVLIREDLEIEGLLTLAVEWRADLQSVRSLVAAASADQRATFWGGFGPQLQVGYQYGGVSSRTATQDFSLHEQRKLYASGGWTLGLAALGQLKTASAAERQAANDAVRQLDVVRAQVVRAAQASATHAKLIPMARQQLNAAEAALKLAQANLRAGTMLTLDVLQAEDSVDQGRLRYADAVVKYNQSQVNLLAAIGLMDELSVASQ